MTVKRFHYAWVVMSVSFVVLLIGAGIRSAPGVLIVPLEREFAWSRAEIGAAIGINIMLFGLMGPFAVAIMDRFGLRRTISVALGLLAVGVFLTIFMQTRWQLMALWGVVVGSGSGMVATIFGATIANRWFVRHRGLVVGILTASGATGQLIFLPLLASLAVHFGWRAVSLALAIVATGLIPVVAILLRDRPADIGLAPYGGSYVEPPVRFQGNPVARSLRGLASGLRSRDFWLLSGSFFVCGASTNGLIGTHLIPACIDHGIPEVSAAGLLAVMGIFDFLGTTGSGWLTDRFDSRKLLFWYYALRGLSLIFLPFAFNYTFYGLSLFAVFYGLDWVATIPPTVRLAETCFGRENAVLMFGWIAASHQLGGAFAAWGGGVLRTETGNYLSAFIGAGVICLLAALMVTFIGRRGVSRTGPVAAAI